MHDGWEAVRLGDVTSQLKKRVDVEEGSHYRLLGVSSKAQGVFEKEPVTSETTKAKYFYYVPSGTFIYNRLFAGSGSFSVVSEELDGSYVSNEFPIFQTDASRLDVHFLGLTFEQPAVWDAVAAQCIGTTGSRMRWKEHLFADFTIFLPPLQEQRRIVDLIDHIDLGIEAARGLASVASRVLRAVRDDMLSTWDTTPIGELLVRLDGGKSVAGADDEPTSADRAILKLSAIQPGLFLPGMSKRVPDDAELPDQNLVGPGDVLMTRSNTPERVGFACHVPEAPSRPTYIPDLVFRLVPDSTQMLPPFLAEVLCATPVRMQVIESASGTSASMRKISKAKIRSYRIPVPPLGEQRRILTILDAVKSCLHAAEAHATRVTSFRSRILASLLSGDREIPEAYDRFLEEQGAA